MNLTAIQHRAKSSDAYAFDHETLHLKLKTGKGDVASVSLLWGDPFHWHKDSQDQWKWDAEKSSQTGMTKLFSDDLYDYWFVKISPQWKRVRYAFLLSHEKKEVLYGARGLYDLSQKPHMRYHLETYFNFPYINQEDVFTTPPWVKETVWYQIFPERFANGDPDINPKGVRPWGSAYEVTNDMLFGGDLEGVINHLDHLVDLGVNGIYFTPIFEASATHKYDTIDYFKIDPSFGTNDTFKRFMKEAHGRGIKVMLDAVFNHCGFQHPFFQDVVEKGEKSKYYDWFHILKTPVINFPVKNGFPQVHAHEVTGKLHYETFAFTPNMPKWRLENPECRQYLLDVAKYWVEVYDIDGWRLDVSNEISHDFWRAFRRSIKAIKPDTFILGENWDDSTPWLRGDQFDAVMNYEFTFPIWRLLADPKNVEDPLNVSGFVASFNRLMFEYPHNIQPYMFNLLDSHDTSRLMSLCGDNPQKVVLAFVLQMTFGGAPSIYYGSEAGLKGLGDGNRQCMPWHASIHETDLYQTLKTLVHLRLKEPLMRQIALEFVEAHDETGFLLIKKTDLNRSLWVAMNLGQNTLTLPSFLRDDHKEVHLNHEALPIENELAPLSARLFITR